MVSAVLVATLSLAQTKAPAQKAPARPKFPDYVASKVSLEKIASNTGTSMMRLKGTEGQFTVNSITSEGRSQIAGVVRIQSVDHYRLDSVFLAPVPFGNCFTGDGQRRFLRIGTKMLTPMLVRQQLAAVKMTPKQMADRFFTDYSRMLFQGVSERKDAWVPLFQGFKQQGYKLKVTERRMTFQGRKYLDYKIVGDRAADPTGAHSKAHFEVIVDGTYWLPVTVEVSWVDAKKKPWRSNWACGYAFNRKFTAKELSMTN